MRRLDTNWYIPGDRVTLYFTERPKHEYTSFDDAEELRYKNVEAFEIISGESATKLEESMDIDIDEHHEYLRLYLANGETATFRNSHTILFSI